MFENASGSDYEAAATAVEKKWRGYRPYEVFYIKPESTVTSSYYLRRADRGPLEAYESGQYLPIRLAVPGQAYPVARTYTISDAPNGGYYRLSIKREGGDALISTFLRDHIQVGDCIEAMAPRGKFFLDQSSDRPVVLLSAGIGITPMIAMANFIVNEGQRSGRLRRSYFIHGARNGLVHAFGEHIRTLAASHEAFSAHVRYSQPRKEDSLGKTHDSEGHVDLELLKRLLPLDDYDFYLCGPPPFMRSLYHGLAGLGVREERIRYESFGPATVLKRDEKSNEAALTAQRR
jgi:ferredoxin-NADP reductase